MRRWRELVKTSFLSVVLVSLVCTSLQAEPKPNVIIVLTDDQGYADLSCHGNPVLKTPAIDQLARESLSFENFHVAPVCTPTRGELMTGLDALHNKASMVPAGRNLMRRDIPTMPEIFQANGYATGLFGKWHLGDTYPHRPMDRGFEQSVWHKGWGLASEIEFDNDYYYTRYYVNDQSTEFSDRYCANLWFDSAFEWMAKQQASGKPFFAYVALNTPHGPLYPQEKDYALYQGASKNEAANKFFGMIHNVDENMARLEEWLNQHQAKENTIVVFMNDNGGTNGVPIYNAGMRGRKGDAYDGGHRAICLMRWPQGGWGPPRSIQSAAHITDLLPTFIDLLDLTVKPETAFDGISLRKPIVELTELKDRCFVVQFGGRERPEKYLHACVVCDNWRLVGKEELYDIVADPGQTNNVAHDFPEVLARLQKFYDQWWAGVEPTIDVIEPVVIGSAQEPSVVATSNNWLEVDVDNRNRVSQAAGPAEGGVIHLENLTDGEFKIEIARWPFYTDLKLTDPPPATTIGGTPWETKGKTLPVWGGVFQVDDRHPVVVEAGRDAQVIETTTHLTQGRHTFQGWFRDARGHELAGAYYVRMTRIPQ